MRKPTFMNSRRAMDDELQTFSSFAQADVERLIAETYKIQNLDSTGHLEFLTAHLFKLPKHFSSLDASRTWLAYWLSHSIRLLDENRIKIYESRIRSFIASCQFVSGGIGGGPGQLPHLAAVYSGTAALLLASSIEAINKTTLYNFLLRMKKSSYRLGGFRMHEDGECDLRGTYCAVAVASVCNLLTDDMVENVEGYVLSCFTYEGGIAGDTGGEAHGGYTYCGLATLAILTERLGVDFFKREERRWLKLLDWLMKRQKYFEGGFCGRTNKLVDSCYSFWIGASIEITIDILTKIGVPADASWKSMHVVKSYILNCCQNESGGFVDKPGKAPDFYHTCYSLSFLFRHKINLLYNLPKDLAH
jgi:protein farnesyltransferase subunit beta